MNRNFITLGVSGTVAVSEAEYVASVGRQPGPDVRLPDEPARIAYVAKRLNDALDHPLTSQGSSGLARAVLDCFRDIELLPAFAEKAIETLRDGKSHNRMAVSPHDPRVAVLFVAWNGTHRDVLPERRGHYLAPLLATAGKIVKAGVQLAGFLEIDAYVREHADAKCPGKPLREVFQVDVEFSYLPGFAFGGCDSDATGLPNAVMLNFDLCSQEERQALSKVTAKRD